jgi:hypothetical protein
VDLDLRASVTAFLCEKGADPSTVNRDGKSSYDLALASDHQELIALIEESLRFKGLGNMVAEPVELSAYPSLQKSLASEILSLDRALQTSIAIFAISSGRIHRAENLYSRIESNYSTSLQRPT